MRIICSIYDNTVIRNRNSDAICDYFFLSQDLYCCLTSWLFQAQVEQRLEQGAANLEAN